MPTPTTRVIYERIKGEVFGVAGDVRNAAGIPTSPTSYTATLEDEDGATIEALTVTTLASPGRYEVDVDTSDLTVGAIYRVRIVPVGLGAPQTISFRVTAF